MHNCTCRHCTCTESTHCGCFSDIGCNCPDDVIECHQYVQLLENPSFYSPPLYYPDFPEFPGVDSLDPGSPFFKGWFTPKEEDAPSKLHKD